MAIVEAPQPLALPPGDADDAHVPMGVFTRAKPSTGWRSWVTSIDHKKIGLMYGFSAFMFFLVGGSEALLIRTQLIHPNGKILNAHQYDQIFTMHGVTMIFLVVMPMAAAFANFLIPLQIGARDVAFPRLNAFGFWCFLFGGLFLNSSWLLGGGADGGWFAYAPNTNPIFSPSHGMDFYCLGLLITGIASQTSALNLIVTTLNMRAPGMTLLKMPVFTWMALVTQFLLVFAIPVITTALFFLLFDRNFGANFFNMQVGADPLLWEHLFWIFGHPEVYILILPSFGIVSEIIPTFSRKPIFGYPFMVGSGIAIGFMGWGVWAHHMFASGLGPYSVAAFSVSTMFIAVPTGVKILNWVATMYGGKLSFDTPMLFAIGLVTMFTIGGLSGVTHAVSPSDTQQTDTYYIVAHFHYVLFGGALLGLFGGMYFWWPKAFGYLLSERLGKIHFWLILIGFNLTFGPMHMLGLEGQPRRTYTYKPGYGFDVWNLVSTLGSYLIAIAVLVFMFNVFRSRSAHRRSGINAVADPWDARGIEWMIPSPAPEHNFDTIPVVTELDEFWHRKYGHDEDGRAVRIAATADVVQKGDATDVHLPSPSYWPIVLAASLPIIAYGVIFNLALSAVGVVVMIAALYGWGLEPADDDDAPHAHGHHDAPDDGSGHAALDAALDAGPEALEAGEADEAAAPAADEEVAPVG